MANYTSTHTGATIDASVTIVSSSGVTQSDLTKLNAVTSSAVELNLLDGVTASTVEINILDGLTATTAELNYLDGADSSITTLSLPDNTTITTFGASLIDDADAASARTTLGVDAAGTDNSTDVTLVTTSHDYLSISGQAITLGSIDISDDTNLVGGTGITLTGDTLSTTDSEIVHDNLSGFVANEHIDHSTVSISAGTGLSGGGDLTSTRTLSIDSSVVTLSGTQTLSNKSISGTANTISNVHIVDDTINTLTIARGGTGGTTASEARSNLNVDVAGTDNSTDVTLVTTSHDYLSLSGQAITLGTIDIGDDTNLVGGTGITLTGDTLSTTDSEIVHDNLSGFVANEHIDHSGVSITAGAGLTGGGDITATRDIAVGAGTGVTVNADDIAIGQDVGTSSDVTFNSVTADIIGDIRGATKFQAKADVALNKGDAVYISGVSGTTPTVDIADANDSAKMPSFGLAASSVSINASVEIITFGTLAGLNTSGFSVGDILFISTNGTSGNTLTATAPSGESSLIQNIGIVQRSHASAGSIKVGGAGRTNATPNLDDGDIFIGNASNQSSTASLNTKIQDYLNTGVNLPSPTFSGDIDFDDASTPVLKITDTTNTVSTIIKSDDSFGNIGTVSNHHLKIKRNDVDVMTFFAGYAAINNDGNDYDFRIIDSGGANLFSTDAANSRVGILDSTPSYTLDVNGTGRFTGAVQLDDNLTVTGDLQVNGTTTTVNQTNLDVSDNIIGLNRGASSNANDSGIIIERGSTGDNAAIIFDESADKFTVGTTTSTPSATGNITVTAGTMVANVEGNVTGNVTGDVTGDVTGNADTATALATGRTISLTGDVTGTSASFDGSGNVNLAATIAANSVALGTDTTGNYMSDLTEGTGIDITHTPAEGSNATIALDLTEVGFGGGANRLITDDGDGTVSTESNLTFDGSTLALTGDLNVGSGDFFVDDSAGRVGIGTTNPSKKLHIKDSTNEIVVLESSDTHTDIVGTDTGGSSRLRWTQGFFQFYTGGDASSASAANSSFAMEIDGNQNVGIGTTSPSEKLHIYGSVDNDDVAVHIQNAFDDDSSATPPSAALTFTTASNNAYLRVFGAPANTADNHKIELGSTAASSYITFKPSGSEAMRIDSSGNVGIGTTSPSAKLDVVGSGNAGIEVTGGSGYVAGYFGTDFDYVAKFESFDASAAIVLEDSNSTGNYNRIGVATHDMFFITNNSEAMRIDSSQNVGIGTNSPSKKLEVAGDVRIASGGDLILSDSGGGNDTFLYNDSQSLIGYINGAERFRVNSSGNVGIGTTSPAGKLDVVPDTDGYSRIGRARVGYVGFADYAGFSHIDRANVSQYAMIQQSDGATFINSASGTPIYFRESNATKMILTGGNVGIGTTSPGYKLDVSGDVRFKDTAAGGALISYFHNDSDNGLGLLVYGSTYSGGSVLSVGANGTAYDHTGNVGIDAGSSSFIALGVGGSEKMRVHTDGNVGIGTTSPSSRLHISQETSTSASTTGTTLLTLTNDVGSDLQQQKTFVDFTLLDDNANETPQVRIGAEVGHNGDANTQQKEGSGAFVVYTNNADTTSGDAGASLAERMRVDYQGNVGIGTTSPSFKLKVNVDNGTYTDIETIAAFQSKRSADSETEAGLFINAIGDALGGQISSNYYYTDNVAARGNTGRSGAIFGMSNNAGAAGTHSSFYWQTSPNNSNTLTDRMQLDTNGNLKLFDNTANPSASSNNAFLFCDSGEMKVLDELGNTTTISPHNFSLIPGGASEDRAWGYYSEKDIVDDEGNVTATQKVNVDMMKLARLVEELTGEKLVYTEED